MMDQPGGNQKKEADQSSGPDPTPNGEAGAALADGEAGKSVAGPAIGSETRKPDNSQSENRTGHNDDDANGNESDKGALNGRTKKSVRWSEELVMESSNSTPSDSSASASASGGGAGYNYNHTPNPNPNPNPSVDSSPELDYSTSFKNTMDNVRGVLGRWGKKVGEASKKAEDLAGNTWQHLKTAPSFADAAMGRIAQGTKVLAEGGYEKIFRQTFETVPEEQLQNSYACYLSTSAGPVMGVLYVSTAKIAFCSDNPLSYKAGEKTEWSYYKVIIPLHQLKAINPSTSRAKPPEKYIQVISVDNHEFWYMGFLNYEGAVNSLQEALQVGTLQSV